MSSFKLTNYDEAWLAQIGGPGTILGGTQGSGGSNSILSAYELRNDGGDPLVHDHGSFGPTETISPPLGNVHVGTLDADTTVTIAPTSSGGSGTLLLWLTQDGTGGWGITWAGSVTEMGTPDTTAGTTNLAVATTVDGGSTWVVAWVGGDASGLDPDDVRDAGHWEVVVSGTGPPVAVSTPADDDWVYAWVPG